MTFAMKPIVLAVAMAASSIAAAASFELIPGTDNQYALGLAVKSLASQENSTPITIL